MPPDAVMHALSEALAGQYAIERELGRGGMGVVYLARDLQLDRLVAIKVLPPALADDEDSLARFVREARTAAQLSHPNVVPVHRADRAGGIAFFVMGFVDGESLGDRIRARGPLPAADVVPWLREVAWALAYAHARGVVHRDVKPENILIERATGRAMVTDFGIARRTEADALTRTGLVLGTAYYMSPEQVGGEALDGRSDLYSLGVVGFHALAGRLPFEGNAIGAVLVAHATKPAPPLASVAPQVPAPLAAVIDRCLAKAPDDRYPTGEALAAALQRALEESEAATSAATPPVMLSEQQAMGLIERAAQLQLEALRRASTEATPDALRSAGAADAPSVTPTPGSGYKLAHIQQAAQEAGISEQYLALAMAELPRDPAGAVVMRESGIWQERSATRFLGTEQRSIAVRRVVRAAPRRVLGAIGVALQQHPFSLRLLRADGGHPLDGGVMVFALPGQIKIVSDSPDQVTSQWMGLRHQLEAEHVQVLMRALPGDADACEVTMFADLRPGVRRNVNSAIGLGGGAGVIGGGFATLVAFQGAGLAALAATGVGAAVVAALGAATVLAYGPYYRYVVRKAERELERAMDALDGGLNAASLFGQLEDDVAKPRRALPEPRRVVTPRP